MTWIKVRLIAVRELIQSSSASAAVNAISCRFEIRWTFSHVFFLLSVNEAIWFLMLHPCSSGGTRGILRSAGTQWQDPPVCHSGIKTSPRLWVSLRSSQLSQWVMWLESYKWTSSLITSWWCEQTFLWPPPDLLTNLWIRESIIWLDTKSSICA